MIHVDPKTKLVFVRGVYTMRDIEEAVLEQLGLKRWNWRAYTIVGLADDNSRGLQTGMGFQPPDDGRGEVGFRYTRKNEVRTGQTDGCNSGREEGGDLPDPLALGRGRKAKVEKGTRSKGRTRRH